MKHQAFIYVASLISHFQVEVIVKKYYHHEPSPSKQVYLVLSSFYVHVVLIHCGA